MKKIVMATLAIVVLVNVCACNSSSNGGTSENTSSSMAFTDMPSSKSTVYSGDSSSDTGEELINFSNIHKLLGYQVAYPDNCVLGSAGLGYAFIYDNYSVIMGAPAESGDVIKVKELAEAVEPCKQYIMDTLEVRDQDLFFAGRTEQDLKETEEYTNSNGISMMKVNGVFKNTFESTEIPYVAYYLAYDSYPSYIVGIPLDVNPAGLEDFMDEMAKHISK